MKQEDLKLVVACLFVLTLSVLLNTFVMTDRLADRVIQKLKRDYVPGPYEPGFDPDKPKPSTTRGAVVRK